eukprot:14040740-Alexandrium_andersonii.AAC.1
MTCLSSSRTARFLRKRSLARPERRATWSEWRGPGGGQGHGSRAGVKPAGSDGLKDARQKDASEH